MQALAELRPAIPLDEGDPADDARLFRRCLGQYGTGVAIITAEADGVRAGVTVNSFASVSLDPPLILWSISRTSRSFPVFQAARRFAVNVLAADQIGVAARFAGKAEDKFAAGGWSAGRHGSPLVDGALVQFECTAEGAFDGGDHVVMLGRVGNVRRFAGEPLLFVAGQYSVGGTHPDVAPNPEAAGDSRGARAEDRLIALVFDLHNMLSARFDEHRTAEGVDVAVSRILAVVYEGPVAEGRLARATYLGQRHVEDALADLAAKSLIATDAEGRVALTDAGRRVREAIRRHWLAFQERQVAGIAPADLDTTIRTLKTLIARNA